MTPDVAISARGLSKRYTRGPENDWSTPEALARLALVPYRKLRGLPPADRRGRQREAFWALQDVSFEVRSGERLGIIGRNGAGKSTLLKILSRVAYPTTGEARIRGRLASLLEVGTGFNPNLTGRENVYLNASIHGLERREIDARFDEIVDFAGIGPFLDTPVKRYSSGMYMRLAFSVAAHLEPDVLLLDEVLAVGDLAFQQKCLNRVNGLASEGRTILFVSHSMAAIAQLCTRAIWLEAGRSVKDGPVQDVIETYVTVMMDVTSSRSWAAPGQEPRAAASNKAGRQVEGSTGGASTTELGFLGSSPRRPTEIQTAPVDVSNGKLSGEREVQAPRTPPGMGARRGAAALEETVTRGRVPEAPGNDHVRLVSARIINSREETITSANIDEPVGIEMIYDVLKQEKLLLPAFRFYSAGGVHLFNAVYTDPQYVYRVKSPGRYVSTAWIPGNLLNSGVVHVTLAVSTPGPQLERHFVVERGVSFHVSEVPKVEGVARGLYTRDFPGALRPKLDWSTQKIG